MTQAPTPGPLSAEDVKLLPCPFCGGPAKLIRPMGEWVGKGNGKDGGYYAPETYRFVCAALYEDPVRYCPGRASPSTETKAVKAWNARAERIAPTAPVEASGSEREEAFCEAYYQAHLDHAWSALREGKPYQVNADGAISLIQQAALDRSTVKAWQMSPRPQPSGETREAVARIVDPDGWRTRDRQIEAIKESLAAGRMTEEEAADARPGPMAYVSRSFSKADDILALLSARPLALGGQHSAGETYWPDIEDLAEKLVKETYRPGKIDGTGYLYTDVVGAVATGIAEERARHTTPARAEAQDEGKAGEPVATHKGFIWKNLHGQECIGWFLPREFMHGSVIELYAHPSPTPAADADRVRIAELEAAIRNARRQLNDMQGDCVFYNLGSVLPEVVAEREAEALAALKSEAK